MHLKRECDNYVLEFARDDVRPVTEVCREVIGEIATNDHINGETVYTKDDSGPIELLAKIALHANLKKGPLPLTSDELSDFEIALRYFSSTEATKKAIDKEVRRAGLLSNTRIEARVDLGRRAAGVLVEIGDQKIMLGDDPAAEALSA